MESSAFLAAVMQMQHMPSDLRQEFAAASEKMTDVQRDSVAAELAALHDALAGAETDLGTAVAKGQDILKQYKHELVPAMRAEQEQSEHQEELQQAESSMNTL